MLVDNTNYRILDACRTPSSASEISDATDIPIATVYRRLEDLEEAELLLSWREYRPGAGGDPKVYQRAEDRITIEFNPPPDEERMNREQRLPTN